MGADILGLLYLTWKDKFLHMHALEVLPISLAFICRLFVLISRAFIFKFQFFLCLMRLLLVRLLWFAIMVSNLVDLEGLVLRVMLLVEESLIIEAPTLGLLPHPPLV